MQNKNSDWDKHCKRNQLISLIRIVCRYYKEDKKFTEEYIQEVLANWSHNLDEAIACFERLKFTTYSRLMGKLYKPIEGHKYCDHNVRNK